MFIAGDLVFLELQKTGGSHIRRLLKRYVNGDPVGKHNRLTNDFVDKFIIGSIRNPWDWYVSLWAYGVSGKGAIRTRVCKGFDFNYYHSMLPKSMGKNWLTPSEFLLSTYHDITKPVMEWKRVYKKADEPELFQQWLKLLLSPRHRFDMGEGYAFSPLSAHAGLMTYRYFRLFTLGQEIYKNKMLADYASVADFDLKHNVIKGMIRTESLEQDFVRVLSEAGLSLTDEQLSEILDKKVSKTNVSERKSVEFYYNEETLELVLMRDRYIIEKYGYQQPRLNQESAP